MGAPPSRSRGNRVRFRGGEFLILSYLDVSQPSLGTENEQVDRLATPPLSPLYSSDGQSVHVSVSSKGGKTQVVYIKPSSATSMETHWEEAIQCTHPEKRPPLTNKIPEVADVDDTESELLVIPESDLSDSTLHDSVQDSFDEGTDELCCPYTKSERSCSIQRKDHSVRSIQHKRPTWIIGSEEESVKSWESKACILQEVKYVNGNGQKYTDLSKNCSKVSNVASTVAMVAGVSAKTVTTDSHRQVTCYSIDTQHIGKPTMGKQKKIIEPCITPASTPVSDCEECFKNHNQILPVPTVERLLPIGAVRQQGN